MEDYLRYIRKQAGFSKYILKLLGPLIKRSLLKESNYYGKPIVYEKKSVWDDIKTQFGIDKSNLTIFKDE